MRRILEYKGKLVEEIGYVQGEKVCFLRYLREEDKDRCPHCGNPIERDINIVEGCNNWKNVVGGVESL